MKPFKTILTAALSLLVLLSSSSFVIGIHLCSGQVQHVGIFTQAQVCEKESDVPPCHPVAKKTCCEDQAIVHPGDDIKPSLSAIHIPAAQALDIANLHVVVSEIIPGTPLPQYLFADYDPPLRADDITIAHRVLLI